MVISSPTASGKTTLFEIAMVKVLMRQEARRERIIYIAPIKALC